MRLSLALCPPKALVLLLMWMKSQPSSSFLRMRRIRTFWTSVESSLKGKGSDAPPTSGSLVLLVLWMATAVWFACSQNNEHKYVTTFKQDDKDGRLG